MATGSSAMSWTGNYSITASDDQKDHKRGGHISIIL